MKRVIKTIIAAAITTMFASMAMANTTKCNHEKGAVRLLGDNTNPDLPQQTQTGQIGVVRGHK